MNEKNIKKFFNTCPNKAVISYVNGEYDIDEHKDKIHKYPPSIIISWLKENHGFGEYTFYFEDGKWKIDSEGDSKKTIKEILGILIDSLELVK